MLLNTNLGFTKNIIKVICLLYILLFVYAAVSKLLDFERFQVQLAQSPILTAYAYWLSYLVVGIELFITMLLLFSRTRTLGLFSALCLMTMFTVYIFIVLNYSSFVPCSCGGILEKLTWRMHFVFNLIFVFLAITAIILDSVQHYENNYKKKLGRYISRIIFLIAGSVAIITTLFLSSEDIVHHKNPFIRRYPKDAIHFLKATNLVFNSYYFAGSHNQIIYLANYTDPLNILSFDSLGNKRKIRLFLSHKNISFRSIKIVVREGYVYLMDGTVPCIFKGNTGDWNLKDSLVGVPRFTTAQPIDSSTIIVRNIEGKSMSSTLGFYKERDTPRIRYVPNLLKKQIDGIFDTDGMLLFNEELKLGVYTYFYRNQFFAFDKYGNQRFLGQTIDTTTTAKIKVADLNNGIEKQLASPPLKVNSKTAVRNDLLLVHSKVRGKFEDESMWKKSSVIDVYNLQNKTYLLSFYIQRKPDQKMNDFYLSNTHLYVLIGTKLQMYRIGNVLKEEMKTVSTAP
jgi:hypothetical protein